MKSFVSGRPYWWQWLTILSLDATAVAVSWQALFGRVTGVPLQPAHRWILASSVWCAYTADRWIEGWRLSPEAALTQRHFFSVRWRWPIFAAWCVVLSGDVGAALFYLNRREFSAGLILLGPVLLYLFSHQFFHRHHPWRLPKEICVAALITGGVLLFPVASPEVEFPPVIALGIGFSLLCFANCGLISVWEREVDERHDQDSLAKRSPRAVRLARALPWIITTTALAWSIAPGTTGDRLAWGSLASSAALLGIVDRIEPSIGRQLARVLSDLVLLTPLVALIAWRN